jgi:membrane-bound serine protease (ClpP class)
MMSFLLNPNVAFVLMSVAFLVTIFALLAPGTGLLEFISIIFLGLVGYTIANMPVNAWAIVLLLAGIVLIIVSLRRYKKTSWLIVSIAILILGMLFVFKAPNQLLAVDPLLALIVIACMGSFIWIVGSNTTKAFAMHPHRDPDKVIGSIGRAVTNVSDSGSVYVDGENWSAVSDQTIPKGSQVIVRQRKGLILTVEIYTEKKLKK